MQNIRVEKNQIILETVLPFKGEYPLYEDNSLRIIQDYEKVLINALTLRASEYSSMLARNFTRVTFTNETIIIFKKEDGTHHQFNISSYNILMRGILLLEQNRYQDFCKKPEIIRQCQKALYWVDKKDVGKYSFGNLITCLEALVLFYECK